MPIALDPNPLLILAEISALYLLPAAGLLMMITALLMMRRKRSGPQAPRLTPGEQVERDRQLRGMRGDLEDLMVEIEQFATRLSAQLDAKTLELDLTIQRANERLAELRRLTGTGEPGAGGRGNGASIGPGDKTASDDAPDEPTAMPTDPLSGSVYRLADQGLPAHVIAQQLNEHIGKIELILALRQTSKGQA